MSPTAANLAAAVERTLDDLGIGDYHVAGYSLGARVAIQLAESDRVRSVIAIAPDGLGTPMERVQGFIAMVAGRGMAMALAPAAGLLSMTPAGRSVFFAGSRSLPWQLAPADARQLLDRLRRLTGVRGDELGVDVRHAHPPAHHHPAHPAAAGHRGSTDGANRSPGTWRSSPARS